MFEPDPGAIERFGIELIILETNTIWISCFQLAQCKIKYYDILNAHHREYRIAYECKINTLN